MTFAPTGERALAGRRPEKPGLASIHQTEQGRHGVPTVMAPIGAPRLCRECPPAIGCLGGGSGDQVDGSPEEMERLKRDQLGGYLVVAEFSDAPVPGYIWGEPVRRVFDTLSAGYSLQASLHAPGPEEAVRVITEGNGTPDDRSRLIPLAPAPLVTPYPA